MKHLGVYTAITSGFFFIGFIMGAIVEASGSAKPSFNDWDLFIMGFIGIAFLLFGFSVLSYLKRKEGKMGKGVGEVDWAED